MTDKLQEAIKARDPDLRKIDDDLFGEAMGVGLAIIDLRKALNEIDSKVGTRQFETAANLGYKDVASAFIFLQRALGGLHKVCMDRDRVVQDIAYELRIPFEGVEPSVNATLSSLQPKPRKRPSKVQSKESLVSVEKRATAADLLASIPKDRVTSVDQVLEAFDKGRKDMQKARGAQRKPKGRY
jgi:hypothetical protein